MVQLIFHTLQKSYTDSIEYKNLVQSQYTVWPIIHIVSLSSATGLYSSLLNLGMMRWMIMSSHTPETATRGALYGAMGPCVHITLRYVSFCDLKIYRLKHLNEVLHWLWCAHFLKMVWATSNRVGCAVQTCYNMLVWGAIWRQATYLVCNYSPK